MGWLIVGLLVLTGACANAAAVVPADRLYVSIGDSYAAGYQPTAGTTTRNGFAYQVAGRAGLRLVNYGCSGITSTALLHDPGCAQGARAPGGPEYAGPQAAAALAFLRRYHTQVSLVTVVIGGNDLQPCLFAADGGERPDATACVTAAVATLRANLATLLTQVRAAVGPDVRVVGLTYPDVYLGAWVRGDHKEATDSVGLFRNVLNPALRDRYTAAGATFVDVTAATGGYDPLTSTVDDPTYGTVPRPVARVCALTFSCSRADPHPTTEGHAAIATEVLAAAGAP
jgi:lysophospholipase L1-like esterase